MPFIKIRKKKPRTLLGAVVFRDYVIVKTKRNPHIHRHRYGNS